MQKTILVLAAILTTVIALDTEHITHCPNYLKTGSEIFTVYDTYNCVATAVSNNELFVSCGHIDTNDKGNYNLTQGETVTFSATSDDPTGFDLTYESTWETIETHDGEDTTVRCWNFTASVFNVSTIEPIPDPEPEPDRYTGYDHVCKGITLSEDSEVAVSFLFEEYSDNYLRYFMYSYDCPGLHGDRKYISSGCSENLCNSSGEWCHMGTARDRFEQTITLTLEQGDHEICAWPSSIQDYLWDAEITIETIISIDDIEQETNNSYSEAPITPINGTISTTTPLELVDTAPLETIGTVPPEVCPQKGEDDCMQNSGCYWTADCGCLHENVGCATPLEQSEIIMNCPRGCVCYQDGAIHCTTVETDVSIMGETMLCREGCILNGRCVIQGTRASIENYGKYCGIYGEWEIQKPLHEFCQNNYECYTNTCASGQCFDVVEEVEKTSNLLQRILDFFARIFGIDITN